MRIDPIIVFTVFFILYGITKLLSYIYSSDKKVTEYKLTIEVNKIIITKNLIAMFLTHAGFFFIIEAFIVIFSPIVMNKGFSYTVFILNNFILIIFLVLSFCIQRLRTKKIFLFIDGNFYFNNNKLSDDYYLSLSIKVKYFYLGTFGYSLHLNINNKEHDIFTAGREVDVKKLKADLEMASFKFR